MSKAETTLSDEQTIAIADAACAQAVFGALHRNLALIQEDFRDGQAPPGAPAYHVTINAHGNNVVLRARQEAAQERARAAWIFDSLVALYGRKRKLREGDVQAAIAFSHRAGAGATSLPDLPQLGGLTLRTPRQLQYADALHNLECDLVLGIGPAGTGKTYIAVAAAVEALRAERVDRIIVTRPAVEAGERLGFLPGDLAEKVDPYLQPIWDAFRGQFGETELRARRDRKQIEVAPLAFMRGRTLSSAFVIIDEAQNATIPQMKMVLTRLGEGSRMVVTGDPSQVDLPRHEPSGLAHAVSILESVKGVEIIRFASADVVRHRLVARIIEAYDREEAQKHTKAAHKDA